MMLEAIDRRTHNNYSSQAALHGIQIPLKTSQPTEPDLEPEMSPEAMQEMRERSQKRVRERYV